MKSTTTVDEYLIKNEKWQVGLQQLRRIFLATDLEETIKWGGPVYTINGKNVVGMAAFKDHFGIWFFQGALLQDKAKVLINAQEGKTKAMRQIRYHAIEDMDENVVRVYVAEAIANQKAGKEIKVQRNKPVVLPTELQAAFQENKTAKQAFQRLSRGRQREYADYIHEAKQEATRQSRLAKILPMILEGRGLNDRYR
jgi:uncharacterized protein YdeI (YjbR/CyaY-like superfamily)